MWNRYGAVVIAIIVFAYSIYDFAFSGRSAALISPCPGKSHDAILACEGKIRLSELRMEDAQLLSLIPESALKELIARRFDVISHGRSLPPRLQNEAFEMIDGIGKARAQELGKLVELN